MKRRWILSLVNKCEDEIIMSWGWDKEKTLSLRLRNLCDFFPLTAIQSENSNLQNKNGDFLNIPMTEMDNGESGVLVTDDGEDAVHV